MQTEIDEVVQNLSVGDRVEYCDGIQMVVVDRNESWIRFGQETSPVGISTWKQSEKKSLHGVERLLESGWEVVSDE